MTTDNFYFSSLKSMTSLYGFSREAIFRVKLGLLSEGLSLTQNALVEINTSKKIPLQVRSGASNGLDHRLSSPITTRA